MNRMEVLARSVVVFLDQTCQEVDFIVLFGKKILHLLVDSIINFSLFPSPDYYFLLFCSNEVGAEAKNPGCAKVFGMRVLIC